MNQLNIDYARKLRDEGMQRAIDHANGVVVTWETQALQFLYEYAQINGKFFIEDVRYASQGVVPLPPSNRSWGHIALKAFKNGWLWKKEGEIGKVKNAKAHRANAQIWRSNILKYQ